MATSSTGRQADLGRFESIDSQTRKRFVEHFDDDGALSARDHVPGCAVNDTHTAMWLPDGSELPIIMSIEEYAGRPVGEWWHVVEDTDDNAVDVVVLSLSEVTHVLNTELVETLADAGDMTVEEILTRARMHNDKNEAPVVFEMDDGRVLLAPRATDHDDIIKEEK